jgi:ABC-type dipeptide/oligopeptide/nickel transport system ATPase component
LIEQGPASTIFSAPQHDYTRLLVNAAISIDDERVA